MTPLTQTLEGGPEARGAQADFMGFLQALLSPNGDAALVKGLPDAAQGALAEGGDLQAFLAQLDGLLQAQGFSSEEFDAETLQALPDGELLQLMQSVVSAFSPFNSVQSQGVATPSFDAQALGQRPASHLAQWRGQLSDLLKQWRGVQSDAQAFLKTDASASPAQMQFQLFNLQQTMQQLVAQWRDLSPAAQANTVLASLAEAEAQSEQADAQTDVQVDDLVSDFDKAWSAKSDLAQWLKPQETTQIKQSVYFAVNQFFQQQQEWSRAMLSRLQWMTNEQISRAQISLNPQRLGPIEVMMNVRDGQVQLTLQAKHQETRKALGQLSESLRESFAEQGLSLASFVVTQMDDFAHQGATSQQSARQFFEHKLAFAQAAQSQLGEGFSLNA